MHDDQLREQFDRWAQPLHAAQPPPVPVLRRRTRRRIAGRTAFSGVLVAGVAVAAFALSGLPRAGNATTPDVVTAPTAPPRYAVSLAHAFGGQGAEVLDMTTGKITGRVTTPVARSDFEWVAAAADDRTFVLADQSQALVYRFYLLHLAANGKPGRLALLKVPPLHSSQIYGMALTADATKLAVVWQNNPTGPLRDRISVTTLASGATRTWTSTQGAAVTVSWAGNHTLAFEWQDNVRPARSGVRELNTASVGSNLLDSRLVLPASTKTATLNSPGNPLITQDGSTVFVTMAAGASGTETAIARFSVRTGRLEAVLTPTPASQSQWYCGILWTDTSGRHVLFQCGTTQASIDAGRYTRIHLPELIPAPEVGFANVFAW
jgi:hypothetical protein